MPCSNLIYWDLLIHWTSHVLVSSVAPTIRKSWSMTQWCDQMYRSMGWSQRQPLSCFALLWKEICGWALRWKPLLTKNNKKVLLPVTTGVKATQPFNKKIIINSQTVWWWSHAGAALDDLDHSWYNHGLCAQIRSENPDENVTFMTSNSNSLG